MREAWTSDGLEYNFDDIGPIPTCTTPVNYSIEKNKKGSVSCVAAATDLPSGTKWDVEKNLTRKSLLLRNKGKKFTKDNHAKTENHPKI